MWLRRPVVACLLLFVIYAGLSLALNDARGTLGTDTGGKLATLHMMERNGGLDPDIGYWAAAVRPDRACCNRCTTRTASATSGSTSPRCRCSTRPTRSTWSVATVACCCSRCSAAVFCALAARALARRLGRGDGWWAFWIVGLATPVAIYSLDFWEHTVGLALMLWGCVMLLDLVDRRAGWRSDWRGALAAGALFGVAATMRTEALVYFVVATGVGCLVILAKQRAIWRAVSTGIAALLGLGAPLLLNRLLEQATLGTDLRGTRVAGTASGAGGASATRAHEALTTSIGLGLANVRPSTEWIVGAMVVVLVAGGAWALSKQDGRWVLAGGAMLAFAFGVYLLRFSQGLGFVPGVLAASPFAAVGVVLAWRRPRLWGPTVVACVALPIAWLTEFSGGADPQWGGRYVLLSGTLLAIVGCVVLQTHLRALVAVLVVAGFVTAGGLVWLSVRSHTVADGMATIVSRHDDVVISRQNHMLREGGAFYDSRLHWLTATTDAQLADAVKIARRSGAKEFALIGAEGQTSPGSIGGYDRQGTELVPFIRPDVKLGVVTYRLPR